MKLRWMAADLKERLRIQEDVRLDDAEHLEQDLRVIRDELYRQWREIHERLRRFRCVTKQGLPEV